jgi:hypothetical protein
VGGGKSWVLAHTPHSDIQEEYCDTATGGRRRQAWARTWLAC